MRRTAMFAGLVTLLSLPATGIAQVTPAGGTAEYGFPASRELTYRIAWGVNVGPDSAHTVVPGFQAPAGFIRTADANGVPRANLNVALVVWGSATHSLLKNDAYRKVKHADNGSIATLERLRDAGVQIIVCGEALRNRNIDRADLLPFVKVAPTATMALATLHAQGYAVFRP